MIKLLVNLIIWPFKLMAWAIKTVLWILLIGIGLFL